MTAEAPWLWRQAGDRASGYWHCESCSAHGNPGGDPPAAAETHVTSTGHTVHIWRGRVTTLEGVSASADQSHV